MAFVKKVDPSIRCAYCGGPHDEEVCPKTWPGSVARRDLRCSYCGSREHDYEDCPKHA